MSLQRDWVRYFIERALGDVLANEAVGVLVGSAFSGVVRGREVEENAGQAFDLLVGVELGTVVYGDVRNRCGCSEMICSSRRLIAAALRAGSLAIRTQPVRRSTSVRMQSLVPEPMTVSISQ
jgi:hypothetical protein